MLKSTSRRIKSISKRPAGKAAPRKPAAPAKAPPKGVERGRKTKAKLKVGICGEHGGDPTSVAFCHEIALDYVSCSPFRVPIARLAAAQAALGKGQAGEA